MRTKNTCEQYSINTYSHKDNSIGELLDAKRDKDLSIGVIIPVKNEEKTIGPIIDLVTEFTRDLVDQLVIVDSGSTDRTPDICKEKTGSFYADKDLAEELGIKEWKRGKGFNMWAGLSKLNTDLVTYLDSDLINPPPHFIYGPLIPLLLNDKIQFSKGGFLLPETDNRATRLVAEPQLGILFPEVTDFFDPLSGMFAARSDLLKKLTYPTGYSVELHLLIESYFEVGTDNISQVFLGPITNGNRDNSHYGLMAGALGYYLLQAAEKYNRLTIDKTIVKPQLTQHLAKEDGSGYVKKTVNIQDIMLPPMNSILNESNL